MRKFGLIGYPLGHSFSPPYFAKKFRDEGIDDAVYEAYPIDHIDKFMELIDSNTIGINVTIPYKELVMIYLDDMSEAAKTIGAVNTIHHIEGRLIGYNTDYYGFKKSLLKMLGNVTISNALVLGTGGSSKAVRYALDQMGIKYSLVSRNTSYLSYGDLNQKIIEEHKLIINTTPLGMFPSIDTFPVIPYASISSKHFCYDLVYNPEKTVFLTEAEKRGATVKNGYDMLILQAEKSWQIWNQKPNNP